MLARNIRQALFRECLKGKSLYFLPLFFFTVTLAFAFATGALAFAFATGALVFTAGVAFFCPNIAS
jgi:hypothetical protein